MEKRGFSGTGSACEKRNYLPHPVYGDIELCDAATELLETPQIARLRGVRQLGFKERYFPGATHTRYIHSIGTAYLAKKLGERLGWPKKKIEKAEIVAILHDAGHGPHSHESEAAIEFFTGRDHDERTIEAIYSREVADTLKKYGYSAVEIIEDERVVGAVRQAWKQHGAPSSKNQHPNADELDYMAIDQHFSGVQLGAATDALMENIVEVDGGRLAVDIDGLEAANSFVLASSRAWHEIYKKDVTDAELYRRAIHNAVKTGIISADGFAGLDDAHADVLLSGMEKWKSKLEKSPKTVGEFDIAPTRDCETHSSKLKKSELKKLSVKRKGFEEILEIENELADRYGLSYLVIYAPSLPFKDGQGLESIPVPEMKIREKDGTMHNLYEYHPETASKLRDAVVKNWSIKVATSPEDAKRLSNKKKLRLAREALNLLLG